MPFIAPIFDTDDQFQAYCHQKMYRYAIIATNMADELLSKNTRKNIININKSMIKLLTDGWYDGGNFFWLFQLKPKLKCVINPIEGTVSSNHSFSFTIPDDDNINKVKVSTEIYKMISSLTTSGVNYKNMSIDEIATIWEFVFTFFTTDDNNSVTCKYDYDFSDVINDEIINSIDIKQLINENENESNLNSIATSLTNNLSRLKEILEKDPFLTGLSNIRVQTPSQILDHIHTSFQLIPIKGNHLRKYLPYFITVQLILKVLELGNKIHDELDHLSDKIINNLAMTGFDFAIQPFDLEPFFNFSHNSETGNKHEIEILTNRINYLTNYLSEINSRNKALNIHDIDRTVIINSKKHIKNNVDNIVHSVYISYSDIHTVNDIVKILSKLDDTKDDEIIDKMKIVEYYRNSIEFKELLDDYRKYFTHADII